MPLFLLTANRWLSSGYTLYVTSLLPAAVNASRVWSTSATEICTSRPPPATKTSSHSSLAVIAAAIATLLGHHLRTGATAAPNSVVAGAERQAQATLKKKAVPPKRRP